MSQMGLATETFGTDTSRVEQNQVNMHFLEQNKIGEGFTQHIWQV